MKLSIGHWVMLWALAPVMTFAQGSMPDLPNRAPEAGTQLILHTGIHVPSGDLAQRFGAANTVGMGVRRTTTSGWRFGFQYRFQTGSDVREPGLLQNLRDPNGHIIDNEGRIALVAVQQRGTLFLGTIGRNGHWAWGMRKLESSRRSEVDTGSIKSTFRTEETG